MFTHWTPPAYHGFRYVALTGLPPAYPVDNTTLTSHFVHSDTPQIGHIHFNSSSSNSSSSSNKSAEVLNRIQKAILYTQASNMHTIPTDCCQREVGQWSW